MVIIPGLDKFLKLDVPNNIIYAKTYMHTLIFFKLEYCEGGEFDVM